MTATRTLYRKANVSSAEAIASLSKRFGAAALVDFEKKAATAEEAVAAKASEGDLIYAATIRVAEFPPAEGGDEESSEAPEPKEEKDDAPAESKSEDKDPDGDGDDDSSSEGDTDHDFAGKGEGEHHGLEPKKLSPEEQIVHLLQQLLDAVKGGDDMGGPDDLGPDGPGGPGLDLPDVGAPDKGDIMGGPGGPPPGGPAGKAPLPPPVKEKSPIGVGAFAKAVAHSEAQMVREDAGSVNNKTIIAEASQYAPTHRVAKIQRTGLAEIEGDLIDLAEAGVALVTLVSK